MSDRIPPNAPDNVVNLNPADPADKFTTKAGIELQERRKVLFRALELAAKQLEQIANDMVKSSILGEHEVKRRIELMDNARCLFVSKTVLEQLVLEEDGKPAEESKR